MKNNSTVSPWIDQDILLFSLVGISIKMKTHTDTSLGVYLMWKKLFVTDFFNQDSSWVKK